MLNNGLRIKIKKTLAIVLTFSMVTLYAVPVTAFADNATPSPSPSSSPAPTTTVQNTATVSNTGSTDSNTGNNNITASPSPSPTSAPSTLAGSVQDPTPTPSSTPTDQNQVLNSPDPTTLQSPSPEPSTPPSATSSGVTVNATNSATITNNTSSTTLTGDNNINLSAGSGQVATGSATATPSATENTSNNNSSLDNSSNSSSGTTIGTGNAVSTTATDNSINTTSVNSKVVNQTINIFVPQNGDINLSDPFTIAANAVQTYPDSPVINVSAVNVNNVAYLDNSLVSYANTGDNSINATGEAALINTGNAYSIVSLVNKVNFTIVNSEIHVVTINLFGQLNGNIILPDMNSSTNCAGCGVNTLNASNSATVSNDVSSTAITGQNNINASGSASITTGDATSAVNTLNLVNTSLVGVNAQVLYINDYGNWNGNFIGWGNAGAQSGGSSLVIYNLGPNGSGCASCSGYLNVNNLANVTNNISSLSNTGGNNINAGGGTIFTGNAYSAVSLINFINSTFINSFGFFGFLNIFGNWTGNIGGQSEFAAQNTQNTNNVQVASTANSSDNTMQPGGMLSVTQTNNTGAYVLPGDTVTFSINVKNTGTGTVYNSQLMLYLIRNGVSAGGATYNLGDIPAGHGVSISTGLVLSKDTPAGTYIARAFVTGNVGPNNATVTSFSDSSFVVFGSGLVPNAKLTENKNNSYNNTEQVLGAHYPYTINSAGANNDYGPLYALVTVIMAYVALRALRQKDKFIIIFGKKISLEDRMKALKMFLM